MEKTEITMELNLKNTIAELREVTEALNEFTDKLEQIENKYVKVHESEEEHGKSK